MVVLGVLGLHSLPVVALVMEESVQELDDVLAELAVVEVVVKERHATQTHVQVYAYQQNIH